MNPADIYVPPVASNFGRPITPTSPTVQGRPSTPGVSGPVVPQVQNDASNASGASSAAPSSSSNATSQSTQSTSTSAPPSLVQQLQAGAGHQGKPRSWKPLNPEGRAIMFTAFKLNERPDINKKRQLVDLLHAAGNTSFTVDSVNAWLSRERKKKKAPQPAPKEEIRHYPSIPVEKEPAIVEMAVELKNPTVSMLQNYAISSEVDLKDLCQLFYDNGSIVPPKAFRLAGLDHLADEAMDVDRKQLLDPLERKRPQLTLESHLPTPSVSTSPEPAEGRDRIIVKTPVTPNADLPPIATLNIKPNAEEDDEDEDDMDMSDDDGGSENVKSAITLLAAQSSTSLLPAHNITTRTTEHVLPSLPPTAGPSSSSAAFSSRPTTTEDGPFRIRPGMLGSPTPASTAPSYVRALASSSPVASTSTAANTSVSAPLHVPPPSTAASSSTLPSQLLTSVAQSASGSQSVAGSSRAVPSPLSPATRPIVPSSAFLSRPPQHASSTRSDVPISPTSSHSTQAPHASTSAPPVQPRSPQTPLAASSPSTAPARVSFYISPFLPGRSTSDSAATRPARSPLQELIARKNTILAEKKKEVASSSSVSSSGSESGFRIEPEDPIPPGLPPRSVQEWCRAFDSQMMQRDKLEETLQKIVPDRTANWQVLMDEAGLWR
ncbi:uncharacterized protein STEHIDRAFT_142653 [Stereum hirsutum FP-91666 SS1]|uniref:uncharacterized protein n=1 Tax=Stereum hirsutum (strain FP-91666) TaxID=721885 RepID=UPI0004449D74|nr:uncharacterized protein STEHIDRAFT_142653 [Stereum hirsutum FP-91666 SS1]EIM80745.1 hypothetical protein STEHIDRAFT_142653 [Stereum hirsutum FP-91666 SS1]